MRFHYAHLSLRGALTAKFPGQQVEVYANISKFVRFDTVAYKQVTFEYAAEIFLMYSCCHQAFSIIRSFTGSWIQ